MSRSGSTAGAAPCDRFEREGLQRLERGEPLDEHFETCEACRAARDEHERLRAGLASMGRVDTGRTDWQARVWAGVARRQERRRRWLLWPAAVVGAAAAAALLFAVLRPAPESAGPALAYAIHRPAQGRAPQRSEHAQPGDRLEVRAAGGGAAHAELRLYRDDRTLLLRCSDQPPCARRGDAIHATVSLDERGRYQLVLLRAARALPAPTGNLDRDIAAARAAGGDVMLRDIDVL